MYKTRRVNFTQYVATCVCTPLDIPYTSMCNNNSYLYTDKVAHKHTHTLQAKDVLCSPLYYVAIPAGGSANSITESARAVSPM